MKRAELPALTGARFYAALLVFLNHVVFVPGCEELRRWPLFTLGGLGVTFFFVLSGFILAYNYEPTFRTAVTVPDYRRFLGDRFSKIYPTYLATLFLAIPISIASPTLPLDPLAVPVQIALVQCWLPFALPPYHAYLNTVGWSISCETLFYLGAPLMIRAVSRTASVAAPLAVLVCSMWAVHATLGLVLGSGDAAAQEYFTERFAPVRSLDFAVGIVVGWAQAHHRLPKGRTSATLPWLGLAWLVLAVAFRDLLPPWIRGPVVFMPGILTILVGLASGQGTLARHLGRPWLRHLGACSFAFYMGHHLVLRGLKGALVKAAVVPSTAMGGVLVAVTLIATCLLACAAYRWFEMPIQRWIRRRIRRMSTSGSPPST